jgi:hypothetical protein
VGPAVEVFGYSPAYIIHELTGMMARSHIITPFLGSTSPPTKVVDEI